jgi:ABC-2 type transport system permease protein
MSAYLRLFVSTMGVHAYNTIRRPFYQIVLFIQPIVIATTVHMLYQHEPAKEVAGFVLLGGGLAGIWSAMTFSSAGDVERERLQGTLGHLLAAPVLLGVPLILPHPFAFFGALAVFLFGASSFALCLANLFLLTRTAWIFQNVLESPLLILGGIAFPVTILPVWVQIIGAGLPMRWGSSALYAALDATPLGDDYWAALGRAFGVGLFYLVAAHLLFGYIEYRVRQRGNLETL